MKSIVKYKVLRYIDWCGAVHFYNRKKQHFVPALMCFPNREEYELTQEEKEQQVKIQVSLGLRKDNFRYYEVDF